jgi:hypothetical protein
VTNPLSDMLFQDGGKDVYIGEENRLHGKNRKELSEEGKILVEAITGRLKGSCKDNCVIDKEAQPYVSHAVTAVKEIGEGSIPNGINKAREQHQEVNGILTFWKAVKSRVAFTLIAAVILGVLGLVVAGFVAKVRGG